MAMDRIDVVFADGEGHWTKEEITFVGDNSGDRSRAVVSALNREKGTEIGELILQSAPFAKVLLPTLWTTHCHYCFISGNTSGTKLSRCGRCRTAYYCSRSCQQKDWTPHHQVECKQLVQLVSLRLQSDQILDVVLLGRVMRLLKLNKEETLTFSPADLVWYEEDLNQESVLLAALAQKLKLVDASVEIVDLQKMLSRFQNNNFSICDDLLLETGAGCYPLAAMVNHSCDPNCAVTFAEKTQTVEFRAIKKISSGEQLTQSYVDIALPRCERQRRLRHKYHFECTCARCAQPLDDPQSVDAFLEADIKGQPLTQSTIDKLERLTKKSSATSLNLEDHIASLKELLAIQQAELHPENIRLLETYSALFSAEMEKGSIMEALSYGEVMLQFYRRVYPVNHPMLGLHLFTLGDLQSQASGLDTKSVPNSLSKARQFLEETKRILETTHGKCHRFVDLLNERLDAL